MQSAIIACQNNEQDMLFKFYDSRNKNRLRKLQTRASTTFQKADDLQKQAGTITSVLKRIDEMGSIQDNYNQKRKELTVEPEEFNNLVLSKIQGGVKKFMGQHFFKKKSGPESSEKKNDDDKDID